MKKQELNKRRYLGILCINKHEYKKTGKSIRYENCRTCCTCNALSVERNKNRYAAYREEEGNKAKMEKYQLRYNKNYRRKNKKING